MVKSQYFRIRKEMFQSKEQVYSASMNQNVFDCELEKITGKENSKANQKVSKSQKHFFLKLHCPKNKQNIRQNSGLEFKKVVR